MLFEDLLPLGLLGTPGDNFICECQQTKQNKIILNKATNWQEKIQDM